MSTRHKKAHLTVQVVRQQDRFTHTSAVTESPLALNTLRSLPKQTRAAARVTNRLDSDTFKVDFQVF